MFSGGGGDEEMDGYPAMRKPTIVMLDGGRQMKDARCKAETEFSVTREALFGRATSHLVPALEPDRLPRIVPGPVIGRQCSPRDAMHCAMPRDLLYCS